MDCRRLFKKTQFIFAPCEANNWRPGILDGKFPVYYLVFLSALKIFTLLFLVSFPENIFFAEIAKTSIINLINQERESLGLQSLKENSALDRAAMLKAQDMMAKDYFSHQSPEGISPWEWLKRADYKYESAGENLAIGFLDSSETYRAWMDSPSHRANILNGEYRETGLAILAGDFNGSEVTVAVNFFGKPAAAAVFPRTEETAPASAEGQKETILPEILGQEPVKTIAGESVRPKQTSALFSFLNFVNRDYYNLVQKIIYFSLIFVIVVLLANVFVRMDIQHPDLILKTLGFAALLVVFAAADKMAMINLIPHNLNVH